MKKTLIFLGAFIFSGCIEQDATLECVDLVGTINNYKNISPEVQMTIVLNKKNSEYYIFEYKKNREFLNEVNSYLYYLDNTSNERNRFISPCDTLSNLREDNETTKEDNLLVKHTFTQKIMKYFSQINKEYFDRHEFIEIDARECRKYLRNATELIEKYGKTYKHSNHLQIEKAVLKFENCKKIHEEGMVSDEKE